MDEECNCGSLDGKFMYYNEFLKPFHIIASSKPKENKNTTLLKCRKCESYYLWDGYGMEYRGEGEISLKKYFPKTEDSKIRRIMNLTEGVINEKMLESNLSLSDKLAKLEMGRISKLNENLN